MGRLGRSVRDISVGIELMQAAKSYCLEQRGSWRGRTGLMDEKPAQTDGRAFIPIATAQTDQFGRVATKPELQHAFGAGAGMIEGRQATFVGG